MNNDFNENDNDVKEVQFGDHEFMDPDEETIVQYLAGYPYRKLASICRQLRLPPAMALKRILPYVEGNDRFTPQKLADAIRQEAATLIGQGWEPGEPPVEPMTDKTAMFKMLDANFVVEIDVRSEWTRDDLAFSMGLSSQEASRVLFDFLVTNTIVSIAKASLISQEEARAQLPTSDYMLGMPVLAELWEANADRYRATLDALADELSEQNKG